MLFDGDAIVLAGGTGRVGGPTLATLLREGARVLVVSRSLESAQRAIDEFGADGRARALPFAADLREADSGDRVVSEIRQCFGRLDAVANLSGRGRFVPLTESTPADLRANLDGFLVSAYNLLVPALRAMLAQPALPGSASRGRLLTVTAGSSKAPQPEFGLFGAAKAGVNILMQAIAREHKADGIVANALVLGGVATEAARGYRSADEFAAAVTPQEVADAVAFLVSRRASGINGALVDVNAREVD